MSGASSIWYWLARAQAERADCLQCLLCLSAFQMSRTAVSAENELEQVTSFYHSLVFAVIKDHFVVIKT